MNESTDNPVLDDQNPEEEALLPEEPLEVPAWVETPAALRTLLQEKVAPLEIEGLYAGQLVVGVVARSEEEALVLTLPGGQEVLVPAQEIRLTPAEEVPAVGQEAPVLLDDERAGRWSGSLAKGKLVARFDAWAKRATGDLVEVEVQHLARGGFVVAVDGLQGFLPGRDSGIARRHAQEVLGTTLRAELARFDEGKAQPVLTRSRVAKEDAARLRETLFARFQVGDRVEGRVARLESFGAFIDLGGVDGLLHVSEIALHPVEHPSHLFEEGDVVEVVITEIDAKRGRVGLSRRELLGESLSTELEGLRAGDRVTGKITRIERYGAFVEIKPGVEGLCHVSELSWTRRVQDPAEVVSVDQEESFLILHVDSDARRISLSLKQTQPNPWEAFLAEHPVGTDIEGTLRRIERFGLFVEVAPGVEGLCHVSDLTWEGRPETPADAGYTQCDVPVTVRILEIDAAKNRLRLGIKQLQGDPWLDAGERVTQGAVFRGRVLRIDDPFAYIEVVPGLEGRLHVSEISEERVDSIRLALRIGQEVEVMTVEAHPERRQLRLSIKAIEAKERAAGLSTWQDSDEGLSPLAEALKASQLKNDD